MDSERELDASFFGRGLKTDILSFDSCAAWLGLTDAVREQVCAKDMPRLRKVASEGTIDFTAAIEAKNECDDPTTEMPVEGWSAGTPYVAKVSNAAWLTTPLQGETSESRNATWGEQRRVVYVEIDVEEAGISYSPGDAIGVCVPNPWSLVEEVAKMVKEVRDGETTLTAAVSVRGETKPKTVEAILSYDADLISVPKKAAVYSLSQCCTDPVEAKNMAWLCSKCAVGKALWAGFVESQGLGLGELIMLFPSCAPTLGALIALAGKPPPRFYSIASSPVAHSRSVACVAFSIVHYTCSLGRDSHASGEAPPLIKRAGLATSYIEQQCAKWLYPGSAVKMTDSSSSSSSGEQEQHHPTLRVFYKPTINFKLPGSVAPPLILIGPGTGVAPFIGFLQHRRHLESQRSKGNRQRSAEDDATMGLWRGGFELEEEELPEELDSVESYIASVPPGDVHLFYGCRNDDDFLFRKELQGFVEDSTLTSLEVAKSRVGEQKQYVTHLMKSRGEELAHTLVRQGGYVYVCGDGNQMAKDVHSALLEVVCEHTEFTEKEGVAFLADLKVRRRYVLDVWS